MSSKVSPSEINLTVADSFIARYQDRVTIDVMLNVDQLDLQPHRPVLDGDFHVAGRATGVGLPVVAEIVNAAFESAALDVIRAAERRAQPLRLAGAWRIWSEHPGNSTDTEVQGAQRSPGEGANPVHVFEIHPVTSVKDLSLLSSFRPIRGYRPGDAEDAFKDYAGLRCRLRHDGRSTTLVTRQGAINDVEFLMEVGEGPQRVVADGRFVDAAALSLNGVRLVQTLRMVFVKDTQPELAVRSLNRGDRLHVWGLPRVDLAAVGRMAGHGNPMHEMATESLPYEIVIVGVYDVAK